MTASNQDLDGLRAVLKVLEDRGGWGRGALDEEPSENGKAGL